METEIIRLWDNENYVYPLIEIKKGFNDNFKAHLKTYQKNEEYNFDDFVLLLNKFDWFIRIIIFDEEVFF